MSSITSCGRRPRTALSAPSASAATRVSKPSSPRMPATSSRISCSSSTIRMSGAIGSPVLFIPYPVPLGFTRFLLLERQSQPNLGAAFLFAEIREADLTAMILEDFSHDREPEAGAFGTRGDVRLRQSVPMLWRQSYPVIEDTE